MSGYIINSYIVGGGAPPEVPVIQAPDYVSSNQTVSFGGVRTLSHGFGTTPRYSQVELVCGTSDGNFASGDRIPHIRYCFDSNFGVNIYSRQVDLSYNTANTRITYGLDGIALPNKNTGAGFIITPGNWSAVVKQWSPLSGSLDAPDYSAPLILYSGSTPISTAHGIGSTPDLLLPHFRCKLTDNGHAVGDRLLTTQVSYNGANGGATTRGRFQAYNSTNIFAGGDTVAMNRNTGDHDALNGGSWDFHWQAWSLHTPQVDQTVTPVAGQKFEVSHSLTNIHLMLCDLVCNANDGGFVAGDVIPSNCVGYDPIGAAVNGESFGYVAGYNTSNLFAVVGSNGIRSWNPTTVADAGVVLDLTKWRLRFRAWGV